MRILLAIFAIVTAILAASCGSDNAGPVATTGNIGGDIEMVGPFNGAAELNVGLFAPGGDTAVQSAVAGRLTSAATATLTGRTISFNFTEVPFGTYEVGVYSDGAAKTFYYRSTGITLSESNHSVDDFSADASFTGPGPFGTISGSAQLSDATAFPGDRVVFIGFSPASAPQNALQTLVAATDVNDGQIIYNGEGIAYGTWIVGLYGYNPATHEVTVYGMKDEPVVVSAASPNLAGVTFGASFAGDPGTDPELGSISGTVTFSAALPAGGSYFIAANTVPPQQGAPPAIVELNAAAVGGDNAFDYTLTPLANGEYSVSIFSYDLATHQATYFGEYDGTVTLSDVSSNPSGVDFSADVSIID
jgi:hypothetical protein